MIAVLYISGWLYYLYSTAPKSDWPNRDWKIFIHPKKKKSGPAKFFLRKL